MDNFGAGASQDYDCQTFSSSWDTIVETTFPEENNTPLNYMFDDNGIGVLCDPSDLANILCSQDILNIDSSQSSLFQNLQSVVKDEVIEVDNNAESTSNTVSTSLISQPASLPASQNWPGEFDFQISFNAQEKKTKGVTWTYSEENDKLYVAKEAPCPINFSTRSRMPTNVQIRAMALYSSPESASEVVERCINHIGEDKAKQIQEAEHLVRCESPMAVYEMDPTTKRYSVVIPYENPPPGQGFSTYIFKFSCFGSCPGPNRRPLMLVFSLEKDSQVVGRCKVDVKICACPGRDSKSDNKNETKASEPTKKRKKTFIDPESSRTNSNAVHPTKKTKRMPDKDGNYHLTVQDKSCYEFLKQMEKYYKIVKTMKSMPPDVKKFLEQYNQRKGYPQCLNL